MIRFKAAARRAFNDTYGGNAFGSDPNGAGEGHVERLSMDVELGGTREIVSLRLSGTRMHWSCTCGELECAHARSALSFLVDAEQNAPARGERFSSEPAAAAGDVRTVDQSDQAARADTAGLRSILEDVLTAVVRSGVDSGVSPSIEEALERLVGAAPEPLPLGISRWIGRLESALCHKDADGSARVLEGATRVIQDLRADAPSGEERQRIVSWLGALAHETADLERISDRTMLEVAREWLPGVQRAGVERRYLVDLDSGEMYREERSRSAQTASLGPCPRVVHVGLASVERAAAPRRIRLLQYATTPDIEEGHWARLGQWALRRFEPLADSYRSAIDAFPGLAEPFALVAPDTISGDGTPVLADEAGRPLPCTGEPAVLRYLEETAGPGAQPLWVAGRLVDPGGVLAIVPLSAAVTRHGRVCFSQM